MPSIGASSGTPGWRGRHMTDATKTTRAEAIAELIDGDDPVSVGTRTLHRARRRPRPRSSAPSSRERLAMVQPPPPRVHGVRRLAILAQRPRQSLCRRVSDLDQVYDRRSTARGALGPRVAIRPRAEK